MTSAPVTERRRALRREVERIAARVARRRQVDLADLLGSKRGRDLETARRTAIRKIASETGATASQIAWAWGCGFGMVQRALQAAQPPRRAPRRATEPTPRAVRPKPLYDERTVERLTWQHGPERAAAIIAGIDPSTIEDIAAWRRLGSARA